MTEPLIMGQVGLSFHTAAAAVLAEVLEDLGHTIEIREAPHEEMFAMLGRGEVDLVCSAWLPASHGGYIAPFEDEIEKLAVIYTPYCIWGISADAPDDIQSVEDLAKPDVAAKLRKLIQGITPGAGISRFSRQMIVDYQLEQHGFHFQNGTVDDCCGAYLDATAAGDLAIVPLWHPQWLHTEAKLRELKDPKGLLGGQDDATMVLRKDAAHKVSAQGIQFLRKVSLENAVVSELDQAICREGLTAREAAKRWIGENRSTVDGWME
ncbi:glycine betaine ABC transporter substrate-binding protein [Pacificoceanicola onchidii]|uniref:glycine betaine ABC transporter substrate-binding protein n=1 Tax=Pacificoceanicola onchidii TaxID=2562685 RepID=UPI0010A69C79|nr:glycine betaine ABC transporter substrate-binding protein [Pacificoceanicola onchidii]